MNRTLSVKDFPWLKCSVLRRRALRRGLVLGHDLSAGHRDGALVLPLPDPGLVQPNAERRHLSDDALLVHIRAVYAESRGGYGWPHIWKELLARGIRVGKGRVQKLMQLHGIRVEGKRRFKVTTDSNQDLPISPNLLDRQFDVAEPDKVWAGDITYIATDDGWLFLAVVIDLFSRQVVGWSLREDMTREIVIAALRMVIDMRGSRRGAQGPRSDDLLMRRRAQVRLD